MPGWLGQEEPGRLALGPGAWVAPDDLHYSFVSSSGPGGQNVNKRATKAELRVALAQIAMPDAARARLERLAGRRVAAGDLVITSDEHRSQGQNKSECLHRLRELVLRALTPPRPRRATRPTRGSVERRLEAKKRTGQVKRRRRSGEE